MLMLKSCCSCIVVILCFVLLPTECDGGWESYESSCYLFRSSVIHQKEYQDAADDCANYGAYLVSINDEDENTYITSMV